MKIQDFTGGLSTRLQPQYIMQNEGVEYSNLDNSKGTLSAVAGSVKSGIFTSRFSVFYNAEKQFVSSNVYRSYVEFQKILYFTDGISQPKKFDGTTENNLGIEAPIAKPDLSITSVLPAPTQVRVSASATGDLPDEETFYRLVNTSGGLYSKAYDFSFDPTIAKGSPTDIIASEAFGRLSIVPRNNVTTAVTFTSAILVQPTDGLDGDLYRIFNGVWRFVRTIVSVGPNLADSVHDISANIPLTEDKIAAIAGDMQYVYTYFNNVDGTESAPSPVSDTLEDALGTVTASLVPSTDPQVTDIRIYRIGGFVTTFSRVAQVGASATAFIDNIKDTDIQGSILDSQDNQAPPTGLSFLAEAYAILFGADGDKLRFTAIGKPDVWPAFNFLQFDAPITGIAPVSNGVLVFTEFRSFIVLGTSPVRFSQQLANGSQGCINTTSVQLLGGSAIWASSDGICVSNGNNVEVVSRPKLGKISLDPVDSVIHDDVYYLVENSGSILAFDYRFNPIFKQFNLGIDSITKGLDILYGHLKGELQQLFAAATNEQLAYKSPKYIEGRITEEKTYKKVYIYHEGDIIINILINNSVVLNRILTGEGSVQMQIPQSSQRGNFIQFDISGTGEVFELEYVVGRGHGHD